MLFWWVLTVMSSLILMQLIPLTTLTSKAGNSTCPPILNVTVFQPSTLMCTCVSNFWTSLGLYDTWDKRKKESRKTSGHWFFERYTIWEIFSKSSIYGNHWARLKSNVFVIEEFLLTYPRKQKTYQNHKLVSEWEFPCHCFISTTWSSFIAVSVFKIAPESSCYRGYAMGSNFGLLITKFEFLWISPQTRSFQREALSPSRRVLGRSSHKLSLFRCSNMLKTNSIFKMLKHVVEWPSVIETQS